LSTRPSVVNKVVLSTRPSVVNKVTMQHYLRCVWKEANVGALIQNTGITKQIIDRLRIICGKPGPVFRPSLK